MSLRRRVLTSSGLNLCDFGLKFASVLVVSPFMIRQLGVEGYGVWFLIFSIASYIELLDLGLANTGVRFIGRSMGLRDTSEGRLAADRVFAWFKRTYRLIGAAALGLALVATAVALWMSATGRAPEGTGLTMGLCAIPLALSFFFRPYRCLLKGHVLYHRLVLASASRTICFTVGVFLVLAQDPRIASLAALWAACALLEQVLIRLLAQPVSRRYRPHPVHAGAVPEAREIRGYAGKQVAIIVSNFLRNRVDVQILAVAIGPAAVTMYAVGIRFVDLFKDLMTAVFGGNFLAAFAQMTARDHQDETVRRILTTVRLSAGLAGSAIILLLTLTPPFIDRWLGPGFEASHLVIYLLIPTVGLFVAQYPAALYLNSINRHGILATIALVGSAVNLLLSILLVWLIGFPGVIVATSVEMALLALWVLPMVFCRRSGIPPGAYGRVLLRGLGSSLPAMIPAIVVHRFWHLGSYPVLVMAGAVVGVACLACLYSLLLAPDERRILHQSLRRFRKQPRDSR